MHVYIYMQICAHVQTYTCICAHIQLLAKRVQEAEKRIEMLSGAANAKDAALMLKQEEIESLTKQVYVCVIYMCVRVCVCV
jgi:hypothetical protein